MPVALPDCEPSLVWVCVDCLFSHHGFDDHEMGEPYPTDPAPLDLLVDAPHVTGGMTSEHHDTPCGSFDSPGGDFLGGQCECEEVTFSWSRCQGCGSNLGGSRHALTAWYPKKVLACT